MHSLKGCITPLIAVILITAAGISGYMLSEYRMAKEKSSSLLILKSKCQEDGERISDERVKVHPSDTFSPNPRYTYSEKLTTCLYAHSYMGPPLLGVGKSYRYNAFITDIYTNQPIIEYSAPDGKQLGSVSRDDFNRKYKELFLTTADFPFGTE